jgi:hypothetical protein
MTIYMVAFLLLMIFASRTTAGEYFVATDGEASNDGTRETPWPSVEHALSITGGGHTNWSQVVVATLVS